MTSLAATYFSNGAILPHAGWWGKVIYRGMMSDIRTFDGWE